MRAAGSPLGWGKCGLMTYPPWAWASSAQWLRVVSMGPPISASEGPSEQKGMTGALEAPQDHVAHEVLAVLLGGVDDVVALAGDAGFAGEVLDVGEEAAPLGLQEVDDVEVLGLGFEVAALRGEEVYVGVAGVPAALVHVYPAPEAQFEVALAGGDVYLGAEGVVFVAARDIDDDLAPGEPALRRAVDIGVADLAEPEVAADVNVPSVEVGVDLIMVSVGLVGHAFGRAEVDAGWDGPPGLVVHDANANPVLARLDELDADVLGIDCAAGLDVLPTSRRRSSRLPCDTSTVAEGTPDSST